MARSALAAVVELARNVVVRLQALVAEEPKCDPGLEGELSRSGDPVLARHIGNCVARVTPVGTLISKAHPDSPQRIDCAVASVIAYERAAWHRVNTVECGVIYA